MSIPKAPLKNVYEVSIAVHGRGGNQWNVYVGATSTMDAERAALGSVTQPPRPGVEIVAIKRLGALWE